MESELNAYEVRKPELGRPMDDRVTAAYIEQTPALTGVAPFDPETDVDLVADINRVIANLRALVAYADPDMVAVMQGVLDEIATLRADDRTAAELLAAAGVYRYASAAERDADLPHRANGDWAWTISSSGATYHRREAGAWALRGEAGSGAGGVATRSLTYAATLASTAGANVDAANSAPALTRTLALSHAARIAVYATSIDRDLDADRLANRPTEDSHLPLIQVTTTGAQTLALRPALQSGTTYARLINLSGGTATVTANLTVEDA